jgi:GR25 family glycosyltransferase involved in LPS biosynthesis
MILDNFPKALWINLDRCVDRRKYMETLLDKYQIEHTRIKAVDGLDHIEMETICDINPRISMLENACTCSHILALKHFIEKMDDQQVVIFEDDISFEFLDLIPFNWSELEKTFPDDYDVIQLAITHEKYITTKLVKIDDTMKYYCSAAYLITRKAAQKILEDYYSEKLQKIILCGKQYANADAMILHNGNVYAIPIITYQITESTIHPYHIYIHMRAKKQQLNEWLKLTKKQ